MDNKKLAKELLKVAKNLCAIEFDTTEALKEYLKEHPGADKSRHKVKKNDSGGEQKQDGGIKKHDSGAIKNILDNSGFSELDKSRKINVKTIYNNIIKSGDIGELEQKINDNIDQEADNIDYANHELKELATQVNQALIREKIETPWSQVQDPKEFLEKHVDKIKHESTKGNIKNNLRLLQKSKEALKTYKKIKQNIPALKEKLQGGDSQSQPKKTPLPRKQNEKLDALKKHTESGNIEMVKDTIQSLTNDINLKQVSPEQAKAIKDEIDKLIPVIHEKRMSLNKKAPVSKGALKKVNNVLKSNKIDENSDELQEMSGFKKTLGQRVPEADKGKWYVRNEQKLKKDFIKNMDPSNYGSQEAFKNARQRIMDMPTSDFGKVLAAIGEEEE